MINVRYYGIGTVQTDHEIYWRRSDVIVVQKHENLCQVIDFACPYNGRVQNKELEKIEHCQDLARELRKIWNMKNKVIPLVIFALGTSPIRNWSKEIGIETQITELQKTALLNTARILRRVLEVHGNLVLLDLKNINSLLKQCLT